MYDPDDTDLDTQTPTAARSNPNRLPALLVLLAGTLLLALAAYRWEVRAEMARLIDPATGLPRTGGVIPARHPRLVVERDGKSLLWGAGEPDTENAEWFDVTDSRIDPKSFQYGIGKDRIKSIDHPEFVPADDPRLAKAGLHGSTVVLGYASGGEARAYPISILNRHELVNDKIAGKPVTVGW